MIKLSREGISDTETGWKLGLLHQTVSQVVSAKEKFSNEIQSAAPVNSQMIRNRNSLMWIWRKFKWSGWKMKPANSSPFSQSLIQRKSSLSSILWRLTQVRKLQKKSLKLAEVGLWDLRRKCYCSCVVTKSCPTILKLASLSMRFPRQEENSHLCNIKVQVCSVLSCSVESNSLQPHGL